MIRGKLLLFSLTMMLLLCFASGCSRTETRSGDNQAENKGAGSASNSSQPALNAAGGANATGGPVSFFRGVIGEKNRIQMRLARSGDEFNGAYS